MLGGIDRVQWLFGRRPADPHGGGLLCPSHQLVVAGQSTLGGTQDLESVEGGHARSHPVEVDAGIGKQQAPVGRADGKPERQPFLSGAVTVRLQQRVQRLAGIVQQQRVFAHLFREKLLR